MEEENTKTVFIFYTLTTDGSSFDIMDVPDGWKWIGAGMTYPISKKENPPTKYKREEQFQGPSETSEEMKQYLDKKLSSLKDAGILKFYHIQDTFLPIPV